MLAGGAFVIAFVVYYTTSTSKDNYIQTVMAWREQSDRSLRNGSSVIISENDSITLDYFPIDPTYNVRAKLTKNEQYETINITETDGSKVGYVLYGTLSFELNEKQLSFVLFQDMNNSTKYLLPFKDRTNGTSTYGAGRMLPVKIIGDASSINLDFNYAFNPYCAYNIEYICPITPKSNHLDVEIPVGEKTPIKPH